MTPTKKQLQIYLPDFQIISIQLCHSYQTGFGQDFREHF